MRICILTPMWSKTLGGVSKTVGFLAEAYEQMGHEVFVLSSDGGDGSIELPKRALKQLPAALLALRRLHPDIVHIHSRLSFVLPAVLYRAGNRRARVGFTFHTQPAMPPCLPFSKATKSTYSGANRVAVQALLNRCDLVTAVANSVFDNLETFCKVRVRERCVIPSAAEEIKEPIGKEAAQRIMEVAECFPVLSTTGVLAWECKVAGHRCCIEAMPAILREYPKAVLLIAGGGNEAFKSYLQGVIDQFGLGECVRLLGNITNVSDLLEATDIYLHMGLHEGCSVAIIEAMAHAKPIVAAKSGGTPELITHEVTGLLADPKPSEVSDSVTRLLGNLGLSEALGCAAKAKAQSVHVYSNTAALYLSAFEKVKR